MSIQFNTSSRVQPIEGRYLAEPGHCLMCSRVPTSGTEWFLNLNIELEWYGFIYLCEGCCHEIASSIGSVREEIHKEANDTISALQKLVSERERSLTYLKEVLNARINAGGSVITDNGDSSSDVLASLGIPADDPAAEYVNSVLNEAESNLTQPGA